MKRFFRKALTVVGVLFVAGLVIVAAAVAALPWIAGKMPLELSRLTLTDGTRQVQMQGMAHLGEPRFYKEVADLVAARRAEGWLVFYEEVKADMADPKAGMADVMSRLGAEWKPTDDRHPYEIIGALLGKDLVLQNNREILGSPGPEVRNVDVTLSQLLAALPPPDGEKEDLDLAEARRMFDEAPGWIQERIRAAVRIALSIASSTEMAREQLPSALTNEREDLVAEAILAEADRNILILYGQAHIDAIRQRLERARPGWRVAAEETTRAF
ncbi:hypothetical protein [Azospirillum sp. SYSU D00513]|uniref:hypothetical protein n=1 Tax=Azospirillum sp. SYSU D00513 TaxID=2812561 RepID=UPI001A97186A|nr:hypothetical protein [Azospirillum sp. SYSU D00513]